MFALAEEGHRSVFQQLVACVLSIRTYDETSIECARRLFRAAPDARAIARLSERDIDRLIAPSTFHTAKAGQIPQNRLAASYDRILALKAGL